MTIGLDTFGYTQGLAGTAPTFRRRMGTVVSVQTGYTMTIQLAGDTTSISGVRYFSHLQPEVGSQVWIDTDGADMIAVGTIAGLGGPAAVGRVYKSATQSIANVTAVDIGFGSTGKIDPHSLWDNTGNFWNIPFDGVWAATATLQWTANATGGRAAYILKNTTIMAIQRCAAFTGATTITNVSTHMKCVKGDVIICQGYQNSGAALDIAPSGEITNFTLAYVGPDA